MTQVQCDLCGSEVGDLAHVCTRCANGLQLDLAAVPELVDELDVVLTKRARMGAGGGGSRSSESPLPFDVTASAVGGDLAAVLGVWAALVMEQRGIAAPLPGSAACARWLGRHIVWLRHHEAGGDCVLEVREAVRAARRIIDRPEGRVYAGLCSSCSAPLYARPGAAEVACRACASDESELVYDVGERRTWMLGELEDLTGNASYVAMVATSLGVKVSPSTVRMWVLRGKLSPYEHAEPLKEGGEPRPLYRVGDVVAVATSQALKKPA